MPSFTGTPGNDIYTGGIGDDTASGGGGNDSLSGADGHDVLAGGPGADTLDGGAGGDILFSGDASPSFNLPYAANSFVLPLMDTGTEVDVLRGGDGSDRIFAGYGDNVDGGANDGAIGDYLYISFQGAPSGVTADFHLATQTIGGGVITNMEYVSYVQGSQFNDNLTMPGYTGGYSDFTAVSGMAGNDTITAGYETGSLFGDAGDDVLDGRPSQYLMVVDGGDGNDTLYTNSNTFAAAYGGAGDDTIYAHGLTHGGAGNDVIVMQTTFYNGLVYGDDGDDQITAASSSNIIAGGSGADTLEGSSGADSLFSGDFVGLGSSAADDMGLEHDRVSGGAGNDALAIGYGDDADGGDGTDTLRLSLGGLGHGIAFDTAGIVSGTPFSLGGGVIQNVETLLYLRGTEFADTLNVQTQAVQMTVNAGAGDDVIVSHGSSVFVLGGDGDDRFVSGAAGDIFDGGAGSDTVDYSTATSGVTVNLASGSGGGGDNLTSVESVLGTNFGDSLAGDAGNNTLTGGPGDDTISDASGSNYLRGGDGADSVQGGSGFDDINGNMGADTLHGNAGDDWVVGGKDNDVQFGDAGSDIVWGNLGDDTLDGGDGNDQVRGGQGDDVLTGGAGDDFVSGDRGNDTVTGGAGADIFHGSQDAGIDRVTDFHIAEGDRVMLDPGTTFTVSQVGADTVIDMGGGNQMILMGVQLSTLTGNWIFGV